MAGKSKTGAGRSRIGRRGFLKTAAAGVLAGAGSRFVPSILSIPAAAAQTPRAGGTLRVAVAMEPFAPAFDLHRIRTLVTSRMGYLAYNGLVNMDANRNVVPDLATSWEQPDPTTYVFELRKDVEFHDGTPCDAAAVKFNIERLADPKTASPKRADFTIIQSTDVLDKNHLRIKLAEPFMPMLSTFRRSYFSVISPTAVEKLMATDPFKASIGTGPFRFASYTRGDKVLLERNKSYWDKRVYLDAIEFRIIPEQATSKAALEAGELDCVMQTNPTYGAEIAASPSLQLLNAPSAIYDYMAFNVNREPFKDKRVRQAFSMAIDREGIAQAVYRGYAIAAQGAISPALKAFYRDNADIPFQKYDPDHAKALLKQADFPFDKELRFDTFADAPWGQVGDALAAQISALGVKLKIVKPDFNTFAKYFYGPKDYWLGNSSWTTGGVDPDGLLYKQFVTGEAINFGNYSNPELDKMLKAARTERDQGKRADLYNQANRLVMEECYVAFLVHPNLIEGMRKAVHGYAFRDESAGPYDDCWLEK
jgi:peptide/nickel transport system substrate-binding protein